VRACVVGVFDAPGASDAGELIHCVRCGLASNAPGVTYDGDGVCSLCRAYASYADRARAYFKTRADLELLAGEMKAASRGGYDCVVLLSGGKDSTYMVHQLCGLGLHPLAFTLDNGFISKDALDNVRRTAQALGLDLVIGRTPHMAAIFADSLERFASPCNGCFKTIYTLAIDLARERGLRYIVTGLSRGQFFETRLTEELFRRPGVDAEAVEALVLEARRAYHKREDVVTSRLGNDGIDQALDQIQFVDFYRYWSVPLAEMLSFLAEHTSWVRPPDTGRSTNCRINEVGIYLHKKRRGFHNYALPYSWDVRLGQKTREEAVAELDDEIDEERVRGIMAEIGYVEPAVASADGARRLAAFCVSGATLDPAGLRAHMSAWLPDYMVPDVFVQVPALPLTRNGKIDRAALAAALRKRTEAPRPVEPPRTPTERALAAIWRDVLQLPSVGANDDFFDLGGQSLGAIRVVSRIQDALGVAVPLRTMFERPTVAGLAEAIDGLSWAARGAIPGAATGAALGEREEVEL